MEEDDDAQNLARIRHPDITACIGVINAPGEIQAGYDHCKTRKQGKHGK